jgi:hypothetical protein
MAVVDFAVRDFIATITINRPEARTAMSPEVMVRLDDAWREVRDSSAIRVAHPDRHRVASVLRRCGPRIDGATRHGRAAAGERMDTRCLQLIRAAKACS